MPAGHHRPVADHPFTDDLRIASEFLPGRGIGGGPTAIEQTGATEQQRPVQTDAVQRNSGAMARSRSGN